MQLFFCPFSLIVSPFFFHFCIFKPFRSASFTSQTLFLLNTSHYSHSCTHPIILKQILDLIILTTFRSDLPIIHSGTSESDHFVVQLFIFFIAWVVVIAHHSSSLSWVWFTCDCRRSSSPHRCGLRVVWVIFSGIDWVRLCWPSTSLSF